MIYRVIWTSEFKKEFKKIIRQGQKEKEVFDVIEMLRSGIRLDEKYCEHKLQGKYKGFLECHVKPDLLMIYKYEKDILLLTLFRIGSHSDLF